MAMFLKCVSNTKRITFKKKFLNCCIDKRILTAIINNPNILVAAAKSLQLRPTLCDPRDGSPPGSPVPGILQARTLEWVAISFSNA